MSINADTAGSRGPATTAVLKAYDTMFIKSRIARAREEVLGGKSVSSVLASRKLADGSDLCTRQNLQKSVKRRRKLMEDATAQSSSASSTDGTEESRRTRARDEALRRYWEQSVSGEVGRGKKRGMRQIKTEVEGEILRAGDKTLNLRTLQDHAGKGPGYTPGRGRPMGSSISIIDDLSNGWKDKIAIRGQVFVVPPLARHGIKPEVPIDWVCGRIWENSHVGDGVRLYGIVYDNDNGKKDVKGGELMYEEHVPEVFVFQMLEGVKCVHDHVFDHEMHDLYLRHAGIRKEMYGDSSLFVKLLCEEKDGPPKVKQDNSAK